MFRIQCCQVYSNCNYINSLNIKCFLGENSNNTMWTGHANYLMLRFTQFTPAAVAFHVRKCQHLGVTKTTTFSRWLSTWRITCTSQIYNRKKKIMLTDYPHQKITLTGRLSTPQPHPCNVTEALKQWDELKGEALWTAFFTRHDEKQDTNQHKVNRRQFLIMNEPIKINKQSGNVF